MSDTEVLSADRVDDWHLQDATAVLRALRTDKDRGLSTPVAAARLADYGPNTVRPEAKPSRLQITLVQLRDPMNLMLIAVSAVAIVIGEGATAAIVIALILLNVIMGANQHLKAQASVDALAGLQVPQAKALRDGVLTLIPAADLVPGDIVSVEAGDLVPAAFGPDRPATDVPTASVTMGFVVMALATAFAGFVMRRSTAACWTRPLLLPTLLTLGAIVLVV